MKKTIAAVAAGLLLVAGQAAAQNNNAVNRVADRVGAQAEEASDLAGVPLVPFIVVVAIMITGVAVALDDDSESD